MRFALAAIALALVTLVPATAGAQSWEEYRPAGIGFRIEMPGKPKLETQKTKAGNTAYHAVATYRDMAFLTIYGEKYEKKSDDREALLETVVKSFTESKKVLSSKKEMIGGYPARRVVIEDADKDKFEARIVIADDRLIQAILSDPPAMRWAGGSWTRSPSWIRSSAPPSYWEMPGRTLHSWNGASLRPEEAHMGERSMRSPARTAPDPCRGYR